MQIISLDSDMVFLQGSQVYTPFRQQQVLQYFQKNNLRSALSKRFMAILLNVKTL